MQGRFTTELGSWRNTGRPLARSLADAVRDAVIDGRITAGAALPSERELTRLLAVSRGTVVAALGLLREDGWLDTRHGSGSVVRLPERLTQRTTPWSQDRGGTAGADLDLTLAITAAPHDAYLAALGRAVERSAALLVDTGTTAPGLPQLRDLVAERYTRAGLPTRAEQVLITSGAQAAVTLLDDHLHRDRRAPVLVESPTFPGALSILRRRRARLVTVPVTAGAGWDTDYLAQTAAANGVRLCYLIPDFHNPTGAHMSGETRAAVSALAERHGLTIVADETMRDLDLRHPPQEFPHLSGPSVVNVGSLSKTVWSGLRVGWIRASAALVRELLRNPLREQLTPPPLEQLIATELLGEPLDAVLADRRGRLRAQRDHLAGLLTETGWTYAVPDGGLSLWLHLGPDTTGAELAKHAAGRGLAVSPGQQFAADRATLTRYLRLPFTATTEVLTRAVRILTSASHR
jgi:DNA-binding transcriptional MocR family regulator